MLGEGKGPRRFTVFTCGWLGVGSTVSFSVVSTPAGVMRAGLTVAANCFCPMAVKRIVRGSSADVMLYLRALVFFIRSDL